MFRITAPRRELYGLGLGVLLLADLAGGAAAVVARASDPGIPPGRVPAATSPPTAPNAAPPGADQSDCGTGTATARAVLDHSGGGYVLRATVANDSNRTVELDRLVVQAVYADGVRSFTAAATGHWIAAGVAQTDLAVPDSASAAPPVRFAITDFAFHTAGRPGCVAR